MIEIEESLTLISEQEVVRRRVLVEVNKSIGRVLSEPVYARIDLPSFDNSAMDGYAVCGDGDEFFVIGEVSAGQVKYDKLEPGEAMRVFTGAKIPDGTTAVVMQEHAQRSGARLTVGSYSNGANIRRQGEELRQGSKLLNADHRITSASVGLLLSQGISYVDVYALPRVSILVTGNELVDAENALVKGQIYESNGGMLAAALMQQGIEKVSLEKVGDDPEEIKRRIASQIGESDLLIVSGGVSVGSYDYVEEALADSGVERIFHGVFQKPGKPLYLGRRKNTFVFGLPGNPGAALTCFYVYVSELLAKLQHKHRSKGRVVLKEPHKVKGTKPVFLRAKIRECQATILKNQSSSMLSSFIGGNGLVLLQPGEHQVGTQMMVWYYE